MYIISNKNENTHIHISYTLNLNFISLFIIWSIFWFEYIIYHLEPYTKYECFITIDTLMSDVYNQRKDADGFLYITYTDETTLGECWE